MAYVPKAFGFHFLLYGTYFFEKKILKQVCKIFNYSKVGLSVNALVR